MIRKRCMGLFILVVCVGLSTGLMESVKAAVIMEPLPESADMPVSLNGVSASTMQNGSLILVTGGRNSSNVDDLTFLIL
ncbi:hypothetical protein [Bacillus horti]|uniref:Uncharacterized protein n=1 Tax=Caldalkalibacillus horti TaxID=77523 RepID=A0ABT9W4G9_9BACI|nr:hypothetical protein [Bacillus horti]MDQ0167974.1 hypothetical protein [Bacillus horti]